MLPDGASAIYGTDAIAGVMNFVTRKDYRAARGGDAQTPEEAGMSHRPTCSSASATSPSQGFNVYGGINYRQQDPMRGTERDFLEDLVHPVARFQRPEPNDVPGEMQGPSSSTGREHQPVNGRAASRSRRFRRRWAPRWASAPTTCGADTQTFTNTIPEQEQNLLLHEGHARAGSPTTPLSGEYFFARNTVTHADRAVARKRPDPVPDQSVLSGPGHHAGQSGAEHGAAGLGRLADHRCSVRDRANRSTTRNACLQTWRARSATFRFHHQVSGFLVQCRGLRNQFLQSVIPSTRSCCATAFRAALARSSAALALLARSPSTAAPLFLNPFGPQTHCR